MKRTQFSFVSLTFVALLFVAAMSCSDDFTEKDALEAQQQVDLTIYVFDPSTSSQPVTGAKVTINQGTNTTEVTTDAKGAANFPKVKVGEYVYSVSADNYTSANGTASAAPENFRQGQVTNKVAIYSLTNESTATVKGVATFEKDVTNLTPEPVAGLKILVRLELNNGYQVFNATTDAQGNYSLKIPTNGVDSYTYVTLSYPDFEADQTIAFNKTSDEVGTFTSANQILPRKENIKTLFSSTTSYTLYNSIPSASSVRSVYAIAETPPTGGTRAIISDVSVNSLGEVTGISFNDGGNYTGDADGKVNVEIFSLDGGSGASIQITLPSGVTSASTAYSTVANRAIVKGSGYPTSTFSLNKISTRNPSSRSGFYVAPGSINIANVDYGTGVARPKQLN